MNSALNMSSRLRWTQFCLITTLFLASRGQNCVPLEGIDDGTPGALRSSDLASLPKTNLFDGLLVNFTVAPLATYETPIAFRLTNIMISTIFSTMAAFHPTALERFGRKGISDSRRRCISDSDEFDLHRRVSLALAIGVAVTRSLPTTYEPLRLRLLQYGLDIAKCPSAPGCGSVNTPWGLVNTISDEMLDVFSRDGWNHDGSLSKTYNRVPYEDFRRHPYSPHNPPSATRWAPLQETNNRGFIFRQEHVVPHIGETARSLHFTDAQICSRRARNPRYNYKSEIHKLLKRSTQLTEARKAEVVVFDNKLTSLVPLQFQYFARRGIPADSMENIAADAAVISVGYESVIASWREKVRYDAVRPPTIVSHVLGRRIVNAYAGPNMGTRRIPANEWQPYIRTMPHAEYPSGSSCLCKAFEEAMVELTGTDDVTSAIGGPLTLTLNRGANPFENGPANSVQLSYRSFSEVARACGSSRLYGGLHFTAAVLEGERVCSGIGKMVASDFKMLVQGETPSYTSMFHGRPRDARKCL